MLRIKQFISQLIIINGLLLMLTETVLAQEHKTKNDSLKFQYKVGLNGTLDKSLVTRLIINSQNSFILRNEWTSFEPIINYRFGYVKPINRPKTDLENDVFVLLKNHFGYQKKVFPSVLMAYENSPNIRRLDHRIFTGLGFGSYLLKSKNQSLQVMLYGLYERSDFEMLQYQIFRLMPFVKANHFFEKKHIGIQYTLQAFLGVNNENNQRFRGSIKPYVKISPKLDFSIAYEMWYENKVSGMQPKEISVLLFGLNYSNF